MKKFAGVLVAIVFVVFMSSLVLAAESKVGTVKSLDTKAGTLVFSPEGGADITLKIDKQADVSKVKAGDKVEVSVEKNTLKQVKAAKKPKAAVGC